LLGRLAMGLVEAADTDPAAPGDLVVSAAGFVSGGGQPCIAPNRSISSRAPRTAVAARGITAIVASLDRKARALSSVVRPPTTRKVSAARASGDSMG